MIEAFALLLGGQLLGEVFVRALHLPLPGPVAGMGLLFALLCWRGRGGRAASAVAPDLGHAADGLLRHLSLLFVPAAVGIVDRLGLIEAHAGAILAAIAVSTVVTLAVAALVFEAVARRLPRAAADPTREDA
jgi:holin-like protein